MALAIKVLVFILLIIILFNLFKAMFSMLKPDANRPNMSHFIGRRLLWTAALIIVLLLSLAFGVIEPNPRPY